MLLSRVGVVRSLYSAADEIHPTDWDLFSYSWNSKHVLYLLWIFFGHTSELFGKNRRIFVTSLGCRRCGPIIKKARRRRKRQKLRQNIACLNAHKHPTYLRNQCVGSWGIDGLRVSSHPRLNLRYRKRASVFRRWLQSESREQT